MAKVGDEVNVGDVVCEVMTDKVDMEVESTASGTLVEIVAESGMVDVGQPIAWLEGEDDSLGLGDLLAGDDSDLPAADTLADDHPDDHAEWEAVSTERPAAPRATPEADAASPDRCPRCPAPADWPASRASTSPPWPAPAPTAWSPWPTSRPPPAPRPPRPPRQPRRRGRCTRGHDDRQDQGPQRDDPRRRGAQDDRERGSAAVHRLARRRARPGRPATRRRLLDHRAAPGLRRRAARGPRPARPLGRHHVHAPRTAGPPPWRWPSRPPAA